MARIQSVGVVGKSSAMRKRPVAVNPKVEFPGWTSLQREPSGAVAPVPA